MKQKIKEILKKNKTVVRLYRKLRRYEDTSPYFDPRIPEISKINSIEDKSTKKRINLLIPSLNKEHVFGGISTALKFFEQFDEKEFDKRIIITSTKIKKDDLKKFVEKGYKINEDVIDTESPLQIVSVFNKKHQLLVSKEDVFIATAWWTAHKIFPVIKWQSENYNQSIKSLIYFIQDYETLFYNWSSRFIYCENTYNSDVPTYAVFNSKELKDYFNLNNYKFKKELYFSPILNDSLKKVLLSDKKPTRKKSIIVYGRPSVDRNVFAIVIDSLKETFKNREDLEEWELISVGESHLDVKIAKDFVIKSKGKLTIEQYADLMLESYAGISLMISPHPSYPPLEMSTFGVKTITNNYANKDLTGFNENIVSVKSCTPELIAKELNKILDSYDGEGERSINKDYVESSEQFKPIVKEIIKDFK